MATCPECEFDEIDTTDHEDGDEVSCPECGKNLILAGTDQLEVADDEDDDDDEDLDDDDDDDADADKDDVAEPGEDGLLDDEDDLDEEEEE